MTKEERNTIQARYTEKFPQGYQYSQARLDVLALLDALTEAEIRAASYREKAAKCVDAEVSALLLESSRDLWKTRAEALERELHQFISDGKHCDNCAECDEDTGICTKTNKRTFWQSGYDCDTWQFDEARFAVTEGATDSGQ